MEEATTRHTLNHMLRRCLCRNASPSRSLLVSRPTDRHLAAFGNDRGGGSVLRGHRLGLEHKSPPAPATTKPRSETIEPSFLRLPTCCQISNHARNATYHVWIPGRAPPNLQGPPNEEVGYVSGLANAPLLPSRQDE